MNKTDQLLNSLNVFIRKAEEDDEKSLVEVIPDFPSLTKIPGYVQEYEKKVARLLRSQRKKFLNGLNEFCKQRLKRNVRSHSGVFYPESICGGRLRGTISGADNRFPAADH